MEFMNSVGNQHIINPDDVEAGTKVTLPRASLPVSFRIKPEMKNKLDQIEQELKKDPAVKWKLVRASRLVPHYTR
jgi:hypothetical protein